MQIQINTDHNIKGHEALAAQVRGVVESALSHLSDHITRVEVHLSDESSHKTTPKRQALHDGSPPRRPPAHRGH